MLLNEGFLILICHWNPSLQLVVKLELGAVRLLDGDELVVQLGERDAVVIFELGWVCREGEDLRDRVLCHAAGNRILVARYVASKKLPEMGIKGAVNVVELSSTKVPSNPGQKTCSRGRNAGMPSLRTDLQTSLLYVPAHNRCSRCSFLGIQYTLDREDWLVKKT